MKTKAKRFISLCMALVFVLGVLPQGVLAAGSTPTISMDSVTATPGDTVEMNVSIADNPGILGATLTVSFQEGLTLTKATAGEAFDALSMTKPGKFTSPCNFVWDGQSIEDSDIKDGVILTLTFAVSEDVASGTELAVNLSSGPFVDADLNSVTCTVNGGTVTVIDYVPGDLNGDQEVNITDVILCRRHIAGGYEQTIREAAADVNADGEINITDVILMRRFIAGGYDVVLKPSGPQHAHSMAATAYKAPTCVDDGNIAYWYCTGCGNYYSDEAGTAKVDLADTVIAATGHSIVIDQEVPATTTATGLTEGSHCSVCNEVLVEQQIIPILQKTEYTITYNVAGNDAYLAQQNIEMPEENKRTFTSNDEVVFADISCPGYEFLGWYDAYGNAMPKVPAGTKRNITVYAKWKIEPYSIVFNYDKELAGLIDTSVLENAEYTVNKTKSLPILHLAGYTFIGWSDENGVLCDQIKPGSTGEKKFYANWISNRNKAWKAKDIGKPYVYEDDDMILFTYEIGKIENVPIYTIEDFGWINPGGISEERTKEVSVQMTEGLIKEYSSAVEKATTDNATWTLSDGWTNSISISEEWATEHNKSVEEVEEQSKTETGNWYVNNSRGGSRTETTIDTTDTYNLTTTTNNKKTYDTSDTTEYNNKSTEGAWNISGSLELGAKESLKTSGVLKKLGADGGLELEQKLTVSGGYESKTTDKTGKDTVTKTGTDTDEGGGTQTGTVKNHTDNTVESSNWNNESGFGGSTSNESSRKVAQAVSEMISNKTGYGESYIKTGSSSQTQGLSTTNVNKDTFSSQVTYSKITEEKDTVTYSTSAAVKGYHRWVMATTAHVFGVVGYDKETESYFTTTYSIMDDSLQKYQDYSYKTGSYNDNQSGVIDFCIPDDITQYVKARTFATEGLEFDLNGYVTAYNGTDSAVIIPEYVAIDNHDKTNTLVKVVGIKETVFKGNKDITGVVLSDFITEIPDSAFDGCSELWEVYGVGVTKIGAGAFAGCEKLRNFALSTAVTELGDGAFSSTDFLEVKANNVSVIEAALKSGATNIVVDLDEFEGTLDDKNLEVPEGTESFVLRGYGKSYNDLTIVSHAEETKLNRLTITSNSGIPLQLDSSEVVLNQVSVNAKGVCAVLYGENTNVSLYGTTKFVSEGVYSILCKNTNIDKIEGQLSTGIEATGNVATCGTITGTNYLKIDNGKVIEIREEDFDKLLHSYNLLFDANGGSCDESKREVPNGVAVGVLPIPTREQYVFVGWYTDAVNGNQVDETTVFTGGTDINLYAHWKPQSYTATWNTGEGYTISVARTSSPIAGEPIGTLHSGDTVYYGDVLNISYIASDYYTINSHGMETVTVDADITGSQIYATARLNDLSGWTLASDVPSDAIVVNQKWIYTLREYTTSSNSSLSGWTKYDTQRTSWGETQGPVYYDPSNGTRDVWSEQYVTSSNYKTVYHYFRYSTAWSGGSGSDKPGTSSGSNYYTYDFDYELIHLGTTGNYSQGYRYYYTAANGNTQSGSYMTVWKCDPFTTQEWVSDNYGTRWYYREPVYTYYYYRDVAKESTSDPTGQANVSNVQEWVQYRAK